MLPQVRSSARQTRRLQTRERILDAAIAEFKGSGMARADVGAIVGAAGVAHGTFYFTSPPRSTCSSSWNAARKHGWPANSPGSLKEDVTSPPH
jgi:hypothetical protein